MHTHPLSIFAYATLLLGFTRCSDVLVDCSDPNEDAAICQEQDNAMPTNPDVGPAPLVCGVDKACLKVSLSQANGTAPTGRVALLWEEPNVFDGAAMLTTLIGYNEALAIDTATQSVDVPLSAVMAPDPATQDVLFRCDRVSASCPQAPFATACTCQGSAPPIAVGSFYVADGLPTEQTGPLSEDDLISSVNLRGKAETTRVVYSAQGASAADAPAVLGQDIVAGVSLMRTGDEAQNEDPNLLYLITAGGEQPFLLCAVGDTACTF